MPSVKCIVYLYNRNLFTNYKSFHKFLFYAQFFSAEFFAYFAKWLTNFFIREGLCWFQIAVAKCSRDSFCKEKKSPLHVAKRADAKSREFQYKLLNRCLATNVLLSKIGIIPSSACSFCGEADESLEHLFVTCYYTKKFWAEVIKWMGNQDIEIEPLSNKDIMFGIMDCNTFIPADVTKLNHPLWY